MKSWITWPLRLVGFAVWYIGAVLKSNITVLRDNLTPGQASTTGIARYETRCATDFELTLLAALITLTPGTLTLGTHTTHDRIHELYVHGLYSANADELRLEIADMEARMLHAIRRNGAQS